MTAANKYDIDTPSDVILDEFKKEFDAFQKPDCDPTNIDEASIDDVVKDIHRAIYGNGERKTKGIIWKLAEYHVKVMDVASRQGKCREQVVKHLMEFDEAVVRRDAGIIGLCKRYPRIAAAVAVVLFFGISSLWALVIEQRQATKIQQVVIDAVNGRFGPQGLQGPAGADGAQGPQGPAGTTSPQVSNH